MLTYPYHGTGIVTYINMLVNLGSFPQGARVVLRQLRQAAHDDLHVGVDGTVGPEVLCLDDQGS